MWTGRAASPFPLRPWIWGNRWAGAGGAGHLLLLSSQEKAGREQQTVRLGRTQVRGRLPTEVTRAESSLWDPSAARVVRKISGAAATSELPGVWVTGRNQLLLERVSGRTALERLIVEPVAPEPPR